MTTTPNCTVTTTQIRRGVNTALSISYASTDSATLTLVCPPKLRSLIDQAIVQWWSGLTPSQKSALGDRGLSYTISASCQKPTVVL